MKKYITLMVIPVFFCCKAPMRNAIESENKNQTTATTNLDSSVNNFRREMLTRVNALRAKGCNCGGIKMPPVKPLRWNDKLEASSQRHALDMATNNHFDHTGTDGSDIGARITDSGYNWGLIGENIAWGYLDMNTVILGWVKSAGHCKQMMTPGFIEMGAAQNGKYWVQDFGTPLK